MYKLAFFLLFSSGICGCSQMQIGNSPQTTKGETPIKHVVCDQGDVNCFVDARYKDLKSCEYHKRFSSMLCDSYLEKGKMICEDVEYERSIQTPSYCLPD